MANATAMVKTISPAKATTPSNFLSESRHTVDDKTIISNEQSKSTPPPKRNECDHSEIEMASDCPLFMDGLQSNFAENAALAALASLLDDDDIEDDDVDVDVADRCKETEKKKSCAQTAIPSPAATHSNKSGGGKAAKIVTKRTDYSPYSKGKQGGTKERKEKKKKGATLGEAQLFLNMWKL